VLLESSQNSASERLLTVTAMKIMRTLQWKNKNSAYAMPTSVYLDLGEGDDSKLGFADENPETYGLTCYHRRMCNS
jgi:hypothetical protein